MDNVNKYRKDLERRLSICENKIRKFNGNADNILDALRYCEDDEDAYRSMEVKEEIASAWIVVKKAKSFEELQEAEDVVARVEMHCEDVIS